MRARGSLRMHHEKSVLALRRTGHLSAHLAARPARPELPKRALMLFYIPIAACVCASYCRPAWLEGELKVRKAGYVDVSRYA